MSWLEGSARSRGGPAYARSLLAALVAVSVYAPAVDGQTVLSRFEGSTEMGMYRAEFDVLPVPNAIARDPQFTANEGSLISRVFTKPAGRTNLEVFRSYERELRDAGFDVTIASGPSIELQQAVTEAYTAPHPVLSRRPYEDTEGRVIGTLLARLERQAEYYLVASRIQGEEALHVAVVLAQYQDLYMIDELRTAAMATGTVTLDLEAVRSAIETDGKVAVYGIQFETGSAELTLPSAAALSVIAQFLESASGTYYVVGHTDDVGGLQSNLDLSDRRAAAVKQALVRDYGVDGSRLETRGVGPLAPVSTNTGEAGRALNRRVEIVQRLR